MGQTIKGSHVRRHIRLLARSVGAAVRGPHLGEAPLPAFDAHYLPASSWCFVVAGVAVALLDAELAGILQRYYADFSFMFLAASVLLLFIVNENLRDRSSEREVFIKVLVVLVALSLLYSALVCFVPETGWYSDIYPWAYQDVIETFQFWT